MQRPDNRAGQCRSAGARQRSRAHGFSLLELMIAIVIMAIVTAFAVPAYADYILRGRLNAGAALLKSTGERLALAYSDNRHYAGAAGACAIAAFSDRDSSFSFTCAATAGGQGFLVTATGTGPTTGFRYSLDEAGVGRTLAVRSGWSSATLPVNRFIVAKE